MIYWEVIYDTHYTWNYDNEHNPMEGLWDIV